MDREKEVEEALAYAEQKDRACFHRLSILAAEVRRLRSSPSESVRASIAKARREIEIAHIEHEGNYRTPCTPKNCHLLAALSALDSPSAEKRGEP